MKKILIGLVISLLTLSGCCKDDYENPYPDPVAPSALIGTWQTEDETFQITFNDGEFFHQYTFGWNFSVIETDELGNKTYYGGYYYLADINNKYDHVPPYVDRYNDGRFIYFHIDSLKEFFHIYKRFVIIDENTIIINNDVEEIENLDFYRYVNDFFKTDVVVLKKIHNQ